MKKFIFGILLFVPVLVFAQQDLNPDSPFVNLQGQVPIIPRYFANGDTILNLNSLNNGVKRYQISKEDSTIMVNNGLGFKKGGIIFLSVDSLIKKNFSFFVKCYASDNEWYENTIKIHVTHNTITLIDVTSDKIEMATGFRKEGKIYVVIAVSMILFFTIIFYLIYLERKVKRLEKSLKGK